MKHSLNKHRQYPLCLFKTLWKWTVAKSIQTRCKRRMRWHKLLVAALFLCDRRCMTTQDGSILQQREARQQVQKMSWGRTKKERREGEKKKTEQEQGIETGYDWRRRRVRKSKRENNSEQPRHADMCQACVYMCRHPKAFRSNTRCIIWAQAYWHMIHLRQTWTHSQTSTEKSGKDIWGLMS